MQKLDDFIASRPPTAQRPLLGLTLLVVEDSRYASEALRLMCLRSGARVRRADTLTHAHRHLGVYRPSVVVVDLGLPDGSGADLIAELARATPRVDVLLGMSGDPDTEALALQAGADGFLEKPIGSLAAFQNAILQHLPADRRPVGPRPIMDEAVSPDALALADDLSMAAQVLSGSTEAHEIGYLTQFLGSLARLTRDDDLARAVGELRDNGSGNGSLRRLSLVVNDRLEQMAAI